MHSIDPYNERFAPDRDADRYYREKVRAVVGIVLDAWEGDSPAVVLSGSLALGEGRVVRADDGIGPASDIDLYLVTTEERHAAGLDLLPRVRAALRRSPGCRGLTVDLGVTSPARLAAAPVSIANRTLAEYGRVLAGDADVLDCMRSLKGQPIPPTDGLLLLQNRTVEALVPVPLFTESSMHDAFWYLHAKTVRDIGLSAAVVAGRFAPRLSDRAELVRATWEGSDLGAVVSDFPALYERAVRDEAGGATASPGANAKSGARDETALRRAWQDLGATLFAVARWEYRAVDPRANGAPTSWVSVGNSPFRRRVKSWLPYATGEPGVFLRALTGGFPGTPMQGAYAAASCLMASVGAAWGDMSGNTDAMLEGARATCPFRAGSRAPEAAWWEMRNAICDYWNETVLGGSRTIEKGSPR
ncbi:MAG: hypothetical protein HKN20_12220 [Gemmatimonadetes bacterium]|nr:hypothetical protein [Gemmatimonadota bacterium]